MLYYLIDIFIRKFLNRNSTLWLSIDLDFQLFFSKTFITKNIYNKKFIQFQYF